MKQLIFSKVLIFLILNNVLGQSDFREAFIIKNNNDTIYGYVDNRGNRANAFQCTYKKTMDSETVEYTPQELKGYRLIDKKFYISANILREGKMDTVFLEYLVDGVLDVYYYRDEHGEHYLYNNGDGNFVELKTSSREIEKDGRKYLIEKKEYVADLKNELKEVPSLADKVPNMSINHKSLIKMANEYHNAVCSDQECIVYEKTVGLKIDFGPLAQMNFLSIKNNGNYEEFTWEEDARFFLSDIQGSSVYYSMGGYINVYAPHFSERTYVGYEVSFGVNSIDLTSEYTDPTHYYYLPSQIKTSQVIFNNSLHIGFVFPERKLQPFFQLGGFYNFLNFTDYFRETDRLNKNGVYYETLTSEYNVFDNRDYGFSFGAGCNLSISEKMKLHFETRYNHGLGWSEFTNADYIKLSVGLEF